MARVGGGQGVGVRVSAMASLFFPVGCTFLFCTNENIGHVVLCFVILSGEPLMVKGIIIPGQ